MKYIMLTLAVFSGCATTNLETMRRVAAIELTGDIDRELAARIVQDLGAASNAETIIIDINSTGGAVLHGVVIAKAIERSRANTVCIADGYAMSMAAYILQSCKVRLATPRSVIMLHKPRVRVDPTGMSKPELDNIKEFMIVQGAAFFAYQLAKTNLSTDQRNAMVALMVDFEREFYFTAEQAAKLGLVDGVITSVSGYINRILNPE